MSASTRSTLFGIIGPERSLAVMVSRLRARSASSDGVSQGIRRLYAFLCNSVPKRLVLQLDRGLRAAIDRQRRIDALDIDLAGRHVEARGDAGLDERLDRGGDVVLHARDGRALAAAGPEDLRPGQQPELRT